MNLDSGHVYVRAHEHPEEVDLWREWIRIKVKSGSEGYVFEDIDNISTDIIRRSDKDPVPWAVVRRFWPGSDPVGKLLAIERKRGNAPMGYAQIRTFGLWDYLTRKGDPLRQRWMGWYLLNHPYEDPWECTYVIINGKRKLTMDELILFLKFELDILPYEFPDYVKGEGG